MRIPTNTYFQQQMLTISKQYESLAKLQAQFVTGKKLQQSSDDPVLASRIKLTEDYMQKLELYKNNGPIAQNRAALFTESISNANNTLDRIHELVQNAENDTLSNNERQIIATSLEGHLKDLLNTANVRDGSGKYIYAGFNTDVPPYALVSGTYVYQGGDQTTSISIGPYADTIYNESGFKVFGDIYNGNGSFTVTANGANTGTAAADAGAVNNSFVSDTYTISFVTNSSGNLAYTVTGAASGQVIPPLPATIPANAPDFDANGAITFNGATLNFSGQPVAGDSFQVDPSVKDNVFNQLRNLIDVLRTPVTNDTERAVFHQNLTNASATFTQISSHLKTYLSEAGTRSAIIDNQINLNKATLDNETVIESRLSDTDMYEVVSKISQQLAGLQATQQSYLRIQDTLFALLQMKM
jgi:flagellar hook-associated protein 3 FlgL